MMMRSKYPSEEEILGTSKFMLFWRCLFYRITYSLLICFMLNVLLQREPELEFGAIYQAKIVEIRRVFISVHFSFMQFSLLTSL